MERAESFGNCLVAAGETGSEIETVIKTGDTSWAVEINDLAIELELDLYDGQVTLFSSLGRPAPQRTSEVYEVLLVYNMLTLETGGVRAGLEEPGGDLVLMANFGSDGLPADRLREILTNFAAKASQLAEMVQAAEIAEPISDFNDFIRI